MTRPLRSLEYEGNPEAKQNDNGVWDSIEASIILL